MKDKVWAFAIYSICYEAIVWGIFAWAVFWRGHSGWWFLAALLLSACQLKSKHFGIDMGKGEEKYESGNR